MYGALSAGLVPWETGLVPGMIALAGLAGNALAQVTLASVVAMVTLRDRRDHSVES